jgi:crotonobetainyl-CoA:carnitine CoA-transferase CaiB-like acyl-CoA transferase
MCAVGALDGVTVVDLTTSFWASTGTTLLADFGADVVRVNQDDSLTEFERLLARRNRRNLSIEGGAGLMALIAKADVLAVDLPFAELEARGLDYETLAEEYPALVYACASGYGAQGPDRDLPALDELAAARTGMMPILPQPGEPPVYTGSGQMYSSVLLALGVMLALCHREQTGEGQRVDVSLLGGNMYGASLDLQAYLAIGGDRMLHPISRLDAGNPMSGPSYPAADGRWVTLTMPDTDRYWPRFAPIVGLDAADPRFDTHEKRCEANRAQLIEHLDAAFRAHPSSHWKRLILELGLSADVIEEYDYPANDPEARRNRYIIEADGRDSIGFPIHMSETPAQLRSAGRLMVT